MDALEKETLAERVRRVEEERDRLSSLLRESKNECEELRGEQELGRQKEEELKWL